MSVDDNSELVEVERRCFKETGNPMHAWAAFRLARVVGSPIPDWVLKYLDQCSRELLSLSSHSSAQGTGKDLGPAIAKTFGLASKGRGSPLVTYHADWMVFGANVRSRMLNGDKEYIAVEEVAKEHAVSKTAVGNSWRLFRAMFPGKSPFPDEAL